MILIPCSLLENFSNSLERFLLVFGFNFLLEIVDSTNLVKLTASQNTHLLLLRNRNLIRKTSAFLQQIDSLLAFPSDGDEKRFSRDAARL